jgi:hypothetical protein
MDEPDCEAVLFQNENVKLTNFAFSETLSNLMLYIKRNTIVDISTKI